MTVKFEDGVVVTKFVTEVESETVNADEGITVGLDDNVTVPLPIVTLDERLTV